MINAKNIDILDYDTDELDENVYDFYFRNEEFAQELEELDVNSQYENAELFFSANLYTHEAKLLCQYWEDGYGERIVQLPITGDDENALLKAAETYVAQTRR